MRQVVQAVCVACLWTLFVAGGVPSSTCRAGDSEQAEAIRPTGDEPVKLFNGKDLGGLYTWLSDAKYDDPRNVFSVTDGMLHISGQGYGYIMTKQPYRDYHLIIEFKWGERTWGDRKDKARDSGVLFHCHGPDGNLGGNWVASIEAQIIEGAVGDLLVLTGKHPENGSRIETSLTAEVTTRDGNTVWQAGGDRRTLSYGRVDWFGRDPDWKDVIGFRGENDVESPYGQWTRMDVICDGGHVVVKVNGVKVNEGFDASPAAGKILVQTEQAEMFVRRWELWPLERAPEFDRDTFSFED